MTPCRTYLVAVVNNLLVTYIYFRTSDRLLDYLALSLPSLSTMAKPDALKYTTQLRGQVTAEQALKVIQDHNFFLETDPNMLSIKTDVKPHGGGGLHDLPDEIKAIKTGDARCYEVVDKMPGVALFVKLLPGLSQITNYYQITDTKDGIFVFLQAPMGVNQERRWVVQEDSEGLKIIEYVTIFCSRLLYGTVKNQQDLHWKDVHAVYVKKIGGEVGEQSGS